MELRQYLEESAGFYRLLGGMFLREMTNEQIDALAQAFSPQGSAADEDAENATEEESPAVASLARYLARRGPHARQDLAVDYARVFLAAGVYEGDTAVPYESVYTSDEGILMQDSRDDVVRRYLAHGFAVDPELNVPEDHLGFELEFMALLADEAAARLDEGGDWRETLRDQRAFACEHILNWVPALIERVDSYAEVPFYPAVTRLALEYAQTTVDVIDEALAE